MTSYIDPKENKDRGLGVEISYDSGRWVVSIWDKDSKFEGYFPSYSRCLIRVAEWILTHEREEA